MGAGKASVFDSVFRVEFAKGMQALYPPAIARIMSFTDILSAVQRIERQAYLSPVSAATKSVNARNYQMLDHSLSKVEMAEYDGGFVIRNRDMRDTKVETWSKKPAELVARCQQYRVTEILDKVADAQTELSFEGISAQYQAANSHLVGTGDNLIASTTTSGTATNIAAIYTGGLVKPLQWYDRQSPKLDSDAGTKQASWNKETKWWVDGEGAAAYGFWWDFVYNVMANAPTVAEFKTMVGDFLAAFRSFKTPDSEYVHEQTEFSKPNLVLVIPPHIETIARQVRDNTMISLTSNEYANSFDFVVTNKMT